MYSKILYEPPYVEIMDVVHEKGFCASGDFSTNPWENDGDGLDFGKPSNWD